MFIPHPQACLPPRGSKAHKIALAFIFLAPIMIAVLAVSLGQDANWDLRNYHWYNAYAYLNGRWTVDLLPSQTPWFYNPTLDLPFYFLAMHLPAKVASFVLGYVQGLNAVLLFLMAHCALTVANPRHKVIAAAALASLGMIGGGGIAMLGTTFYDNVTSLGVFASMLFIMRQGARLLALSGRKPALTLRQSMVRAALYALPLGIVIGLKLPSVIFAVGLCFALLGSGGIFSRRLVVTFGFGLGILAGIALSLGHWAWFLQSHFDSPLFPYFNNFFHAPLAPDTSARDTQYVPRSLHDALLFPFIFALEPHRTGEIPWRDWRLPMLYALLPLAVFLRLLFGRNPKAVDVLTEGFATRYALLAASLTYLVWLVMFSIYRYAVPLEMIAPLLIVMACGLLPLRLPTRGLVAGFLLIVVAASIQPGNWGRREQWNEPFVSADIPPLGDTHDLMILMAGFEPYSHLVATFPAEIPFVRIQSNFASPDEAKGINKVIHDRVITHHGRFLMLIPPWQHHFAIDALRYFGLRLKSGPCATVIDHLYNDAAMDLCAVERLP